MSNDDLRERVPTTEQVRKEYQAGVTNCGCCIGEFPEDAAVFDAWLDAHTAQVRAETALSIALAIETERWDVWDKAPGHYAGLAHAARIARRLTSEQVGER